jgi:superfamily II DNA or RNA helicase
MAFPTFLSQLTKEEKDTLASDLIVRPAPPASIPSRILASLPAAAAAVLSAPPAPPFNFFHLNLDTDEIRIPFFYARTMFGEESIQDNIWPSGPESLSTKSIKIEMRPEQIPVIEKSNLDLEEYSTTTIGLPPGAGKTIIGVVLAAKRGLITCYLVPREILVDQWITTIAKVFFAGDVDAAKKVIYVPGQKAKEIKKKGPIWTEFGAMVALIDRVESLPLAIRKRIGTLVIDEGHMLCTRNRVNALLAFAPRYVIVETATLERKDEAHVMMKLLAGPHGFFSTSNRPFTVEKLQTGVRVEEKLSKAGLLDYTALCVKISENEEFNAAIVDTVLKNPLRKFIILTRLVSHAKALSESLRTSGITSEAMCGSRKRHQDVRALVGTMPKISTGYDVATAAENYDGNPADTLILAHSIKQWQSFEQSKGRIMRAKEGVVPVVVWMATLNTITSRHLHSLKEWISKTGGTVNNRTNGSPGILIS